jgi:hypothetical protein
MYAALVISAQVAILVVFRAINLFAGRFALKLHRSKLFPVCSVLQQALVHSAHLG